MLYADAHVAEHEFEEVLRLDRSSAAEHGFDQRGADRSRLGHGHAGEDVGYFSQGERRSRGCARRRGHQIEGRSTHISVFSVSGGQGDVSCTANRKQGLAEKRSAGVQLSGVSASAKRVPAR